MIAFEAIRDSVGSMTNFVLDQDEVRITTHCLYPTNSLVSVVVRGGVRENQKEFFVTDDGGAIKEAASVGLSIGPIRSGIISRLNMQGLRLDRGAILSPIVPIEGVGAAVTLVANASKEAADWCFDKFKYRRTRKFKELVAELLGHQFGDNLKQEYEVVGYSNKRHRFEHAVVRGSSIALIDSATPDSASINSRVVANLDVRNLKNPNLDQFVIYDDQEIWDSSNLSLLSMAASLVPFSNAGGFSRTLGGLR